MSSAGPAISGDSKGCGLLSLPTCVSLSEEGGRQPWNLEGRGEGSLMTRTLLSLQREQGLTLDGVGAKWGLSASWGWLRFSNVGVTPPPNNVSQSSKTLGLRVQHPCQSWRLKTPAHTPRGPT